MVAQPKPIPQQTISQGFGFIFRIWCYRFGEKRYQTNKYHKPDSHLDKNLQPKKHDKVYDSVFDDSNSIGEIFHIDENDNMVIRESMLTQKSNSSEN
jgi:hypothetical protein